jgi:hypothetical protein
VRRRQFGSKASMHEPDCRPTTAHGASFRGQAGRGGPPSGNSPGPHGPPESQPSLSTSACPKAHKTPLFVLYKCRRAFYPPRTPRVQRTARMPPAGGSAVSGCARHFRDLRTGETGCRVPHHRWVLHKPTRRPGDGNDACPVRPHLGLESHLACAECGSAARIPRRPTDPPSQAIVRSGGVTDSESDPTGPGTRRG